jgi:hypothetical protein
MSSGSDNTSVSLGTTARTDDDSQEIPNGLLSSEAHLRTLAINTRGIF